MAAVSQADSKRMYSWWWDSHISPKNSKWLQENLTDMDVKVKQMIKLIEEDADSFARRAEMYYEKRPELMKLVEEFYRAYRALAERYDHATGVLRQAHRTMAEAFPNQVPLMLTDDSPIGSADSEPCTPDMPPIRALFDSDELQKDALGISTSHSPAVKKHGAFTEESDSVPGRRGLKQLNDLFGTGEGRARKGLSFHDAEEKYQGVQDDGKNDIKAQVPSDSELLSKAEQEIVTLKNILAKLEAEKEAGLLEYQQSLQRLSNLESEVSCAKEDSSKAEAEVQTLKEALTKLEAEREASLLQYQHCLDKIAYLENNISNAQKDAKELNERSCKADKLEAEKEDILLQYKQCLEKITCLEGKILHAEEDARRFNECADKAEMEVERLKEVLAKLTEEKEAAAVQYQQCLDTISSLEQKLAFVQEEAQRLKSELDDGVVKLKGAEEKCLQLERSNQTMHSELESLAQKMSAQSDELTEKQEELGRLWTCIQEERLRFVEAETAFQTLQHLHSQSQEELRSMAAELQNRAEILQDLEVCNQSLQNEVEKVKIENKGLSEVNSSSTLTIQDLQDEISNLRQTIGKLEAEVELRLDQRNALQQEIYCLKEEIKGINKKNQAIMDQVDSVGFSPECLGSSVKGLQDENIKLKEVCETERGQNVALLEKLEIMEKLVEKNALLENSLSDLHVELEGVREKVRALEESCQSLIEEKSTLVSEKSTLVSHLQIATDNLEELAEKNTILESSLLDAYAEIEGLREKSKSIQDLYMLLDNEKSDLVTEKGNLVSQLDVTQKRLEDLEKVYRDLKEKYSALDKERESTLHEVEELHVHLNAQKQERATLAQLSESQLAGMATRIRMLQEEGQCIKKEHEEELDKAFYAQTEIFILQKCVQDLEEHKFSHFLECQKFLEASKLSEKLISELELENLEQQVEMKSLYDKIDVLRVGLYRVLKTLELDVKQGCEDKAEQDQMLLSHALDKLQETQRFLFEMQDQNQQLVVENTVLVTLLGQLQREVANLMTAKSSLDQELACRSEQFFILHGESQKLAEVNEELRSKIIDGDHKEESLKVELKTLHGQLLDLQGDYQNLQKENCKMVDEQRLLMKSISNLREEKCNLEDENCAIFAETVSLSTISLIFRDIISEKFLGMKELCENLDKLHHVNNGLNEKVKIMEGKLLELSAVKDEKRELHKMVEELKCKYDEVELIRADLDKELACRSEQFFILHGESQKLAEVNEELRSKIIDGDHKEESLKVELKTLHGQLLDLQGDYQNLQKENCKMVDEQRLLMKSISNLREEKCNLEDENCAIFAETVSLSTISLIFRDIISEKFLGMKELCENLDKLHHVNNGLNEKVKIMEGKLLELSAVKDEKRELHKMVEELKCKYDEVELIRADLDQELASRSEQLLVLHGEGQKLAEVNEELRSKIIEGDHKEESLKVELKTLHGQLLDLQGDYQNLQKENCKMVDEQRLLMKSISNLREEKCNLEGENCAIFAETVSLSTISLIFRDIISEKFLEIKELCENLDKLHHVNIGLNEKVKIMEGKLLELSAVKDEKRELHKMVEELKCKYDEVELIRADLDQELASRSEQFLVLHGESQKLAEVNEELRSKIIEGDHKEESLKVELKTLHGQLLDLQGDYQNLQKENCKMVDEQRWLMKSITNLGEDKCNLEDENCAIFAETVSLSTISLIFRDIISEKLLEMKELSENLDELLHVNNGLNEKVKIMEGVLLELSAVKDKKRELHKMVEDLKCKYDEIELIRADQEKQIIKLSGDCYEQTKEVECIQEANRKLETELGKLNGELLENKIREESLNCELQKRRNEVEWWESQAAALFGELQTSAVQQALYEGKVHELIETCESLEGRNCLKASEIDQMKERVGTVEHKNEELRSQMTSYVPAFISLMDCIASLENHTLSHAKLHEIHKKEAKDAPFAVDAESCQQISDDQISVGPGGLLDLQGLQMRIIAIEEAVKERERLVILENSNANSKLADAIRQIEELKSISNSNEEAIESSKHRNQNPEDKELGSEAYGNLGLQKPIHETSEERTEVMTKDIMLDQTSECSSYGISRRETGEADNQMLEICESTDRNDSIDLTVGKAQKETAASTENKEDPSMESMVEKHVSVDKLEISKRLSGSRQEVNERKILERLDSDAQKLTNLQITVQDMKRKVEITDKNKKGKGIEYDSVKGQLEESEEAITKLFDVNRKLMKSIEDEPLSIDEKSALASDENGSVRKRRISEQARRGSEKIGRLQLEVQKLQFLLLKLDDENKSRGKTKIVERNTGVRLRDYLYGGTRTSQKREKGHFCACMQPPTKGD
ncbi:hypothetical protein P3X46_015286 [Hevea brasiliensis]|uniref:NAB domain-containing protein n=1 Tax=Hevea brasiliensis TaxID=3981 RepID=A0ABQ9LWR8_HEVBR|nr:protein NETWORKED 1D-like [Hevea brasiliensis]XP_058008711.1 protein NETWORKED 1D-like [Hevea brasiliensis]XP_058008712.1 protein NETWORKED 1D-like [Hevea brasiliensis]KAJ9171993.1 hypothetical protein P3X46_015286 [Hevea brasiliensis]